MVEDKDARASLSGKGGRRQERQRDRDRPVSHVQMRRTACRGGWDAASLGSLRARYRAIGLLFVLVQSCHDPT